MTNIVDIIKYMDTSEIKKLELKKENGNFELLGYLENEKKPKIILSVMVDYLEQKQN